MAQGFEVYDETGALVFSTADRAYRVLTMISAGGADGSQSVPALAGGTAIVAALGSDLDKDQPVPSVSGTTVSWAYTNKFGDPDLGARIQVAVF